MANEEHTKDLGEIFNKMDKNGYGRLSIRELTDAYQMYFKDDFSSMQELQKVLEQIDQDKNGYIEYEEF